MGLRTNRRRLLGSLGAVWLLCLAASLGAGDGWRDSYPVPVDEHTAKPLYAEIALPLNGQQSLYLRWVAARPGRPRDLIYLDANYNGRLEPNEWVRANVKAEQSGAAIVEFPLLPLDFAQGRNAPPLPGRILFNSSVLPDEQSRLQQRCQAVLCFALHEDDTVWEYSVSGPVAFGADAARPPLSGVEGDIVVETEVRPDLKQRELTYLGPLVTWGNMRLEGEYGRHERMPTYLTITDADDTVVREEQLQTPGCRVRLPAGTYRVEVTFDTGPLAGEVIGETEFVVK